jgi:hypothetical protein
MATKKIKIVKFDKAIAKQIGQEVLSAVQIVATAYGLTVEYAGSTYRELELSTKVKFTLADGFRDAYVAHAASLGLKPEGLDQTFTSKGRLCKIIGLDRYKRYPVQTEVVGTGARIDFDEDAVRTAMGWQKPEPKFPVGKTVAEIVAEAAAAAK